MRSRPRRREERARRIVPSFACARSRPGGRGSAAATPFSLLVKRDHCVRLSGEDQG